MTLPCSISLSAARLEQNPASLRYLFILVDDESTEDPRKQSEEYIKKHLTNKKINILEIGSSWGYFLLCAKKKGHKCTGVEINEIRRKYINKNLKINCFANIEELKNSKFDKIFLFYSLEYISKPLNYLKKLKNYLRKGGEIIIYTPNKNDHLNCLADLKEYDKFFYEENSINYFSQKSLKNLCKKITNNYSVILLQGYSIINLINWLLHKKPFSTGYVGKDNFLKEIISKLKAKTKSQENIVKKIKNKFIKFDFFFKKNLILNNISNIILLKIK